MEREGERRRSEAKREGVERDEQKRKKTLPVFWKKRQSLVDFLGAEREANDPLRVARRSEIRKSSHIR